MKSSQVYAGAVVLGAITGMRSMAAPAVLGKISRNAPGGSISGPLAIMGNSSFFPVSGALAVGELIFDKLPFTPNRTAAGPLLGRAVIGALGGAALCAGKQRSKLAGALIGAAAAVGAAYGAYYLRRSIGQRLHLPDPLIAIAEDAIVGGVGVALASRFSQTA